nr:RNA-directed DNA polymerase, eukaryota [Tanacetum cinerariifolium]
MPNERKDRPVSSDKLRDSPYQCSTGHSKQSLNKYPLESEETTNQWDDARCPVCMEHPHNAVLLLCSSHDKDFNEVRYKSERFCLNFKAHDADIFNSFIHNAGLKEVHLGGSAFTWCHKSATKMSKLDRFLIFEIVLHSCSNINAISLDRYISDHRPILLREAIFDYGPIPFRFYNYWLEVDGFDKLVRDAWNDAPDDPVKVKYEFLDHFRNRFDKPPKNRARIDICFLNVLSNDQRDDLERMVTKEEVKKAVWDCGSDKSPGPDGFSFSFFRHFWSTIEKDIFEAVDYFFTNGDIPNGCNSNFIALISKIIDANMVKEFRPISLIGSLYKVGKNMSRNESWKEVVDKVLSRLSKWKTKTLSIGGGVIKELFPRLYALELHKDATVRMKLMALSLDNSFR